MKGSRQEIEAIENKRLRCGFYQLQTQRLIFAGNRQPSEQTIAASEKLRLDVKSQRGLEGRQE